MLTSVPSHEVQLLVSPPKMVQENILALDALSDRIQFSKLCEDAWLKHRISAGTMYKTRPDEDDGYGQLVPLCREYTLSRAHPQSRVFAAIPGGTIVGPVVEVRTVKILGQPGLEIAIPSTHSHETTSYVMITRGKKPFVDEVHDHKLNSDTAQNSS